MNKGYTSTEQSNRLLELGIDANTADMYYYHGKINSFVKYADTIRDDFKMEDVDLPAWSLSALLELMPTHYVVEKCTDSYCCYNLSVNEFFANTAVDAAFKMVCWLLENKKYE